MKGRLITFEGIDGCGKTTQAIMLTNFFLCRDVPVRLLREPGDTPLGEHIRTVLLDRANADMSPQSELFLYLAARSQLTATVIKPSLERGELVILDRFIDSTAAYQGYARGFGFNRVRSLNLLATGGLVPDLTFFIDIDPDIALGRFEGERDRLESEGLSFMKRVREGYHKIACREKERMVICKGDRPIDKIHWEVISWVVRKFPELDRD
ncbi:dTMP kinase [Candidatus Latescibacterota bacterium]